MGIKSWIINRLEKDIESSAGHVELENLAEEDREEMYSSRKPFAFDLKKRLLSYLRGTKQIAETTTASPIHKNKKIHGNFRIKKNFQ